MEQVHVQAIQGNPRGADLRFGYIELASTPERIYALFSGNLRGEMPGRANFGKHIHVYGWTGERLATFELPERALSIAVDPDADRLIAVHHEPVPTISFYPLGRLGAR